jgi:DNA (cytosine-5)-methyltransferase 1
MKPVNKEPYNPLTTMLKGCITTDGGADNYHYNGKRKLTPRELCLFQSFPIDYHFTEVKGEAIKQIGNAFPPVMAEAMYRTVAKTLEALDHKLINAEDTIDNIDALLQDKGIVIPVASQSPYRYLKRSNGSVHSRNPGPSSLFGRREIAPEGSNGRKRGAASIPLRPSSQRRRVMTDAEIAEENGDLIMLD